MQMRSCGRAKATAVIRISKGCVPSVFTIRDLEKLITEPISNHHMNGERQRAKLLKVSEEAFPVEMKRSDQSRGSLRCTAKLTVHPAPR